MAKAEKQKKEEIVETGLPEDVIESTQQNSKDLVILGIPKIGKGTILGDFTKKYNALVWDLEKGGYEYISARKMSIYTNDNTGIKEAFDNYIKQRALLLENAGKYEYLIVDGLSDLDVLSELGGTYAYMNSVQGKGYNRVGGIRDGEKLEFGHPEFKLVITMPEGYGYRWSREWFLNQLEVFKRISPYRIYAAHIADKYIKENNKEQVIGAEIALTGQLKRILASRVTSMAKLVADGNERYLNFDILNDSILAGSRNPKLSGRILISDKQEDGTVKTFWENIYSK